MDTYTAPQLFKCHDCEKEIVRTSPYLPGYGTNKGDKICYACCGIRDKKEMETADRFLLYLTKNARDEYEVCNWPGTLRFPAHVHTGKHNLARVQYFVRFKDHTGAEWSGRVVGDNTQICHCRRLKKG